MKRINVIGDGGPVKYLRKLEDQLGAELMAPRGVSFRGVLPGCRSGVPSRLSSMTLFQKTQNIEVISANGRILRRFREREVVIRLL